MKTLDKIFHRGSLFIFLILFLASCATATPDINLQGTDLRMRLDKPATGISTLNASTKDPYIITTDIYRSGSGGSALRIWDISKGVLVKSMKEESGDVIASAISPYGKYMVSSSIKNKKWQAHISLRKLLTGEVTIRNLSTGEVIKTISQLPASSVSFSRDGKYFATRGGAKEVYTTVYETSTGEKIRTFQMPDRSSAFAHPGYYGVVVFSPDGKHVLTGGMDGVLRLMDIGTGRIARTFEGHRSKRLGGINSIAFSPDGKYILSSAFFDDYIILWDFETGKEIRRFTGFKSTFGRSVLSVKFAPDGKTAIFLGIPFVKFMDTESWQEKPVKFKFQYKMKITRVVDPVSAVYSSDGKRLFVSTGDAATRIFDIATGEEIAVMVGFDNGEWVFITSEGYYNASENGAKHLSVKVGNKKYDVDKFYDVFYRPDIVAAKLRGEDIKDLITITMQDAIKSPPPIVEITQVPKETDQLKVKVCYQAKSTGGGIGEVRLFHNGKLIESDGYYKKVVKSTNEKMQLMALNSKAIYEDMRGLKVMEKTEISPIKAKSKGEVFNDCKEIEVIPGENEISVTAFDKNNIVQSYMKTINFNSKIKSEEPHLYILSIGINKYKDKNITLQYAVKDSMDIEEKLIQQASTVYKSQNIHYELLTDNKAAKADIINKINELSKAIKPNDSFILFVAGHGVLLQNQYYMLTHDFDGIVSEGSMISSNEIVEISKKIKSLSQLFIFDTCHAGGVDYIISGLYDARMSVLAKKMGLHIYASANSLQEAMDGYKGNGLFSYALLDGLNNNIHADKNKDKKISLMELGKFSKETTIDISKKIGHAQMPLIINFGKDSTVYRLR